jgi:hypothetical protein
MEAIREAIKQGLMALVLLRLDGQPPGDTIKGTLAIWEEALRPYLWGNPASEAQRIARGFKALLPIVKKWPPPALLIENMPPRPAKRYLSPPPPTEQERQQGRAAIQDILANLSKEERR